MRVGEAFPGQFIKAADLQGKRVQVVIESVGAEDIGGETKPVLHFKGKDRGMVLNKTNANAIWGIAGTDETDDWPGVSITLYPTKVEFQGKRVDAIRVDPPDRPAKPAPKPRPESALELARAALDEGSDSSVPF